MSLRIRLNVFITLLFLLALVLGVVLVIYNTRHAVQDELVSTANLTLELLGRTLASPNQPDYAYDDSRLFERINVLENTRHLCVGLYDEAGTPSAQSSGCTGHKTAAAPSWFRRLVAPEALEFHRALPVNGFGHTELVVHADPADEITEAWQEASGLLMLMIGFWLVGNVLVFVSLGLLMRPIDIILKGLDGIEHGKLRAASTRVQIARVRPHLVKLQSYGRGAGEDYGGKPLPDAEVA